MRRGDLVLDYGGRFGSYNVYLLVARKVGGSGWWVRNLGELGFKDSWTKELIELHNFSESYLKVNLASISKEKYEVYLEFKEKYFNTDSV